MSRRVVLIGGAPTVGKSTVAQMVARELDLPWISTDQIRETMRLVASRNEYPTLFDPEGYTAERFLNEFPPEQIVEMEMKQAEPVWRGVRQFIDDTYTWSNGVVVEGVSILPHLIATDYGEADWVKPIFLFDTDEERMRKVIYERGLWDDAKTYTDEVKEKEVVWATLFGRTLEAEVRECGYPWVEVMKQAGDVRTVLVAAGI